MNSSSISINILLFKINSFENASAINIGENFLTDWYNSSEINTGKGQDSGVKQDKKRVWYKERGMT